MQLDNRTYDLVKWVAQILLPALGTLYFALAQIWNLPSPEAVVGTIVAVDTFLGVMLGLSAGAYNKNPDGDLFVSESDGEKFLSLGINGSVDRMASKSVVRLNVVPVREKPPAL
jgi:hypothetical protein